MTASLCSHTQKVLAVDISELDTKLVKATEQAILAGLQEHVWHGMTSTCTLSVLAL